MEGVEVMGHGSESYANHFKCETSSVEKGPPAVPIAISLYESRLPSFGKPVVFREVIEDVNKLHQIMLPWE